MDLRIFPVMVKGVKNWRVDVNTIKIHQHNNYYRMRLLYDCLKLMREYVEKKYQMPEITGGRGRHGYGLWLNNYGEGILLFKTKSKKTIQRVRQIINNELQQYVLIKKEEDLWIQF
ncbi:MAG: hypothetical protein WC389_19035 [Lutibacter sp.]|jgi:hypothetical protein